MWIGSPTHLQVSLLHPSLTKDTQMNDELLYPTLFKMTSTGKIQEWNIRIKMTSGVCQYIIDHGYIGGKIQTKPTIVHTGKNIGKANETTTWKQCKLEAESLWTKQRDRKGYSVDIPSAKPLRPMLAKNYTKDSHHIKFPAYVQPKLDGIRCLAMYRDGEVVLVSRTGNRRTSLKHIEKALEPIFKTNPDIILDGELYNHELKDNFQTIVSAIKRDEPSQDTDLIEYHVYDIVESDIDYVIRKAVLRKVLDLTDPISPVRGVLTVCVNDKNDVEMQYGRFTNLGYEGTMVRNVKGGYKINGRSADLQKYKEFMDAEFRIVDAIENKGTQVNQCTFICETDQGTRFGVKPKGDSVCREQYWTDWKAGKLHGKMLTVRFFEWTTSKESVPRFPIGMYIRDFE